MKPKQPYLSHALNSAWSRNRYWSAGLVFLMAGLLLPHICLAQETTAFNEFYTWLEEENQTEENLSDLNQRLEHYRKHPIRLNEADEQILNEVFFLNPLQIHQLLEHIRTTGPLKELSELQMLPGFSTAFIRQISPYITCNQSQSPLPGFRKMMQQGEHEVILRHTLIHQQKKGYTGKGKSYYVGEPDHLLIKYKLTVNPVLQVRLVMEKDPGEAFFSRKNPIGFDFISGNITYSGKGRTSRLILGNYSLQFGQGLSLWSGTAFGRGADVAGAAKKDIGLQPYFSTDEQQYFSGISHEYKLLKNILLTNFISIKKSDAVIHYRSDGKPSVTTISSSGLHRTAAELRNKHTLKETIVGTSLQYFHGFFKAGVTAYRSSYNIPFVIDQALYHQYNFQGSNRYNYAFHYNYTLHNTYLFGELARSSSRGQAWIQGLLFGLSRSLSAVVSVRNYSKEHISFYSMPFGSNSNAMNEKGIYAGINYQPHSHWMFAGYLDLLRFPEAKYRADLPSDGYEYAIKAFYTPDRTTKYSIQYRSSRKQQNSVSGLKIPVLDFLHYKIMHLEMEYYRNRHFRLKHQAGINSFSKGKSRPTYGYLLAQDLYYQAAPGPLSGNISIAGFMIPGYDNRIYRYENNVQFGGSSVPYYGIGFRTYMNVAFNVSRQLKIWARYALTWLPGTTLSGTGMEEIRGDLKSETRLQLRYNF